MKFDVDLASSMACFSLKTDIARNLQRGFITEILSLIIPLGMFSEKKPLLRKMISVPMKRSHSSKHTTAITDLMNEQLEHPELERHLIPPIVIDHFPPETLEQ